MEKTTVHGDLGSWSQNTFLLGNTNLVSARFESGATMDWHTHDRPSLHLVLQGSVREREEGRHDVFKRGTSWLRREDQLHCDEFGSSGAVVLVFFLADRFERLSHELPSTTAHDSAAAMPFLPIGLRLREELARPDSYTPMAVEGLLLEMIALVLRAQGREDDEQQAPSWLSHLRALLDRLPLNESPTVRELALEVHRSSAQVARQFRRFYGLGIGDYLRTRRLEHAQERLRDGDEDLVRIALDCGFYDQSHFTHHFKRATGTTPSRFRDRHRKGL